MEKLFNYTDIKFIFLFSIKDLLRSKTKLLSISITLFLSLFIYSTILTINLSLNEELSKNQKTLLGGDLEIDYNRGKADYNLISKIEKIAQEIYSASEVVADTKVRQQLKDFEEKGFGKLPVCIAKTQYSFSTDPGLKGAPTGHVLPVREVRLSSGA